jgi:hypothetical protein
VEELVKKLTGEQVKKKGAFFAEIRQRQEEVEDAIANYNAAVVECNEFIVDLAQEMSDYCAERSEKWTESDKGQAYDAWYCAYAEAQCEEIDSTNLDFVDVDSLEPTLADAPEEA